MNKLLTKIFLRKKGKWELILGSLGFLIGLAMLLICLQFLFDIDFIFNRRLSLEKQLDYIILSKKVNLTSVMNKNSAGFSDREITDIKAQSFVEDSGIITANEFTAQATVSAFGKGFITELFFESVPDRFLDVIPDTWAWNEESDTVPVMISRDFLLLYNFGFSQARDFPFISEEMLKLVHVELEIAGNGKDKILNARIAGLSDRIASFLVPDSFMTWANKHFSNSRQPRPSRIIISVRNRSNPDIITYIHNHQYETSKEKLRLSDAGFTISIILGIVALIGILLVVLSFIIFMVTLRLIISRSYEEITLLIDLGYTIKMLVKNLMIVILPLFGIISTAVSILFITSITLFHHFLLEKGITHPGVMYPVILFTGFLFIAAGIAGNYLSMVFSIGGKRRR
ncbi:MAG: hypothetical protein JXB88_05815 [Spirochaetales bacterium]|nr:hypothetical protein [Spirochaetales bacterium]